MKVLMNIKVKNKHIFCILKNNIYQNERKYPHINNIRDLYERSQKLTNPLVHKNNSFGHILNIFYNDQNQNQEVNFLEYNFLLKNVAENEQFFLLETDSYSSHCKTINDIINRNKIFKKQGIEIHLECRKVLLNPSDNYYKKLSECLKKKWHSKEKKAYYLLINFYNVENNYFEETVNELDKDVEKEILAYLIKQENSSQNKNINSSQSYISDKILIDGSDCILSEINGTAEVNVHENTNSPQLYVTDSEESFSDRTLVNNINSVNFSESNYLSNNYNLVNNVLNNVSNEFENQYMIGEVVYYNRNNISRIIGKLFNCNGEIEIYSIDHRKIGTFNFNANNFNFNANNFIRESNHIILSNKIIEIVFDKNNYWLVEDSNTIGLLSLTNNKLKIGMNILDNNSLALDFLIPQETVVSTNDLLDLKINLQKYESVERTVKRTMLNENQLFFSNGLSINNFDPF
ncbi:hypothetical protein BCR36DRAFT_415867 [Piromyces finnis]|uniref:Uncharacterized protein n=1 Tax=Piromyces finnis TaxID=1754191 RepID=A0A1Y1UX67_9FUNG|nr:hypothetical protein BCR36DRAFT_415867 [Piromyces finnis]|eukprot:ORX42815.1 hypothetical protein BCR36DRAFT_415867 [Piromyces finnis]